MTVNSLYLCDILKKINVGSTLFYEPLELTIKLSDIFSHIKLFEISNTHEYGTQFALIVLLQCWVKILNFFLH